MDAPLKERERRGVIKAFRWIQTHHVYSCFIYYLSLVCSQSIFLSFSLYHSLSTLSFPHGFSPCFLFRSLIPHCSPPFFLFIHATGSLLIICDLLKYIHCFSLWFSLLFFISWSLSSSLISPLFPILTNIHEYFSLSFLLSSISLALSQFVISQHIFLLSSLSYPVNPFRHPA